MATLALALIATSCTPEVGPEVFPIGEDGEPIPVLGYEVVNVFPHDPEAFTQGLAYQEGYLYESTGLQGRSSVRKVDLETGQVLELRALTPDLFGEGLTVYEDHLIQLTLSSNTGLVYDRATFRELDRFSYPTEGWGLTADERRLIMSDGTNIIRYLDPNTFHEVGRIAVTDGTTPVDMLNELEFVDGEVLANVWQTDRIARISPDTGALIGWIDLSGILNVDLAPGVLNGIAYDVEGGRLFVTGKNWPSVFEIRLVPR